MNRVKDLATLLKLELEIVASEHSNLEKMSDEKLKLYVGSLKDQVDALELELHTLPAHPRFLEISEFSNYPARVAIQRIGEEVRDYKRHAAQYQRIIELFSRSNHKQQIKIFVNDYIEEMEQASFLETDFSTFMSEFGNRAR